MLLTKQTLQMSTSPPLFTNDPSVLFSRGNAFLFTFTSRSETGNSIARLIIYASIALAAYLDDLHFIAYGALAVVVVACFFSGIPSGGLPLNDSYHKSRVSRVYDKALGQSKAQEKENFRAMLLSNVREQNYYLGEDYAAPNGIEYMLGGTRPLAPNRTDALRNNKYFANVSNQVYYAPAIPVKEF